jgi:hypothetical protein
LAAAGQWQILELLSSSHIFMCRSIASLLFFIDRSNRMRAIIRFSVDREKDSNLRNKLLARLRAAGFSLQRNTGTYEHPNINSYELSVVLEDFWRTAYNHQPAQPNKYGHGRVDHFWMYCDRKPRERPQLRVA